MKRRKFRLLIWAAALALLCCSRGEVLPAGGGAVVTVPEQTPVVALTFDDGPHAVNTKRLLEGLALREIPATFFLVGERLGGNEALVREMAAAGHQIGIHTWSHIMLDEQVSSETFLRETARTRAALMDILGEGDYWLRPPYGIMTRELQGLECGPLIIWSVDPEDWRDRDTARIVNEVLSRVTDGDIILMHDMFAASVDAALEICDELTARGYCFVTVEQLMALGGVTPEAGVRYDKIP